MTKQLRKGDLARLISVPEWLVHDLPADEQREVRSCVGKPAVVSEVDSHGFYWIGFGETQDADDHARYRGHSFCVPRDCLEAF